MQLMLRWRSGEISLHEIRAEGPEEADGKRSSVEIPLGSAGLDFDLTPLTLTSETERARLVEALLSLSQSSPVKDLSVHLEIPAIWGIELRLPPLRLPPAELAEHLQWELSSALLDPVDQYRYHYAFGDDGSIRLAALRARLLDLIQQTAAEAGYKLLSLRFDEIDFAQVDFLQVSSPPKAALPIAALPPPAKSDQARTEKSAGVQRKAASGQPAWFIGLVIIAGIVVVALWGWMKLTNERRPGRLPDQVISTGEIRTERETAALESPQSTTSLPDSAARGTTAPATEAAPEQIVEEIKTGATGYAPMVNRLAVLQQAMGEGAGRMPFDLISFTGDRFLIQFAGAENADRNEFCNRLRAMPGVLEVHEPIKKQGRAAAQAGINGRLKLGTDGQPAARLDAAQISAAGKKCGLKHPSAEGLIFAGAGSQVMSFLNEISAQNGAVYRLIIIPWGEGQYRVVLEL
jgi:hypothetical protein